MPFLVPNVLLLAIALNGGGVLFAILPPVIRIARPPLLRAVQTHLAVFRILCDLAAVILSAPAALATGSAANRLRRLILRGMEGPLTVAASPFDHTGVVSSCGAPQLGGRFRNCYRVRTASWPMAVSLETQWGPGSPPADCRFSGTPISLRNSPATNTAQVLWRQHRRKCGRFIPASTEKAKIEPARPMEKPNAVSIGHIEGRG
jgi:hypothetical protein